MIRIYLFLLPLLMLCVTGCTGTSVAAKYGLFSTVPVIVKRTLAYSTASNDTNTVAACQSLAATVQTQNTIDVDRVQAAWPPVQRAYLTYLTGDARYTPQDRARMGDTVNIIQRIIDDEQQRRKSFLGLMLPAAGPSARPILLP